MTKPFVAPMLGEHVRLRLLEERDLELTRGWRNQPDVRQWFVNSETVTPERHRQWYVDYCGWADDFVFVIEQVHDRRPVGQVSLYRVDRDRGSAEFGRMMIGEPSARQRGLAREATLLTLALAFDQWQLSVLALEVKATNVAARRLYCHCGFVETSRHGGLVRMHQYRHQQ